METIDVGKIAERRGKIEEEIAKLSERVLQLRSELADLDIADRVIGRITGKTTGGAVSGSVYKSRKRPREGKPANLPTLREMIINVLKKSELEGRTALEPKDFATLIAKNYSSAVKRDSITAVAWTMWKRGMLSKSGTGYTLPAGDPS